jgi:hypothetical protein
MDPGHKARDDTSRLEFRFRLGGLLNGGELQPSPPVRSSRRKVHSSVASVGCSRLPETTRPVARSTVASIREKRMATVA